MAEDSETGAFVLATQGGITFFGNILGKGLGLLFVATVTRLVSPAEYGIFTLALSIVAFSQGFANLGLHKSIDYFIPKHIDNNEYGKAKDTLKNVFLIGATTSIVGAIFIYVFKQQLSTLFEEPGLIFVLPIMVLLIPLGTTNRIMISSFNSIKKMKYRVVVQDLLNPVLRIIAVVGLISTGLGLIGLVSGVVLGTTITVLFAILFLLYEAEWVYSTTNDSISNRAILSYSLPLVLAGVIYSLVGQIDYFVIGYFLNSAKVGEYRIGYLLASNLLIVLSAITPIFKPMIAEKESNKNILEDRYQLATRWVIMATIPLGITLSLAPKAYLTIFFTSEYATASATVIVLVIGYLLNASCGPEGMMLEGLGYTRLTLLNTIILVGVNAILNVLFVPPLGILGAGIATGSALVVAGIAGISEIYILKGVIPYNQKTLRTIIAGFFSLAMSWSLISFIKSQKVIALTLPMLVVVSYIIGLQLVNAFTEDDIKIGDRIDSKLGYPIIRKTIIR